MKMDEAMEKRARDWINAKWGAIPCDLAEALAAFASSILAEARQDEEKLRAWYESYEELGLGYDAERGFYNKRAEAAEQQLAEARAELTVCKTELGTMDKRIEIAQELLADAQKGEPKK